MKEGTNNRLELYRMRVYPIDEEFGEPEWVAEFPDLPGCVGGGDTAREAVSKAMEAKEAWIEAAIEDGQEIPLPNDLYEIDFSGKFTLRLPKSLHRDLALRAEDEGVSLNQLILYLISKGMQVEKTILNRYDDLNIVRANIMKQIKDIPSILWNQPEYRDYIATEIHHWSPLRGGKYE